MALREVKTLQSFTYLGLVGATLEDLKPPEGERLAGDDPGFPKKGNSYLRDNKPSPLESPYRQRRQAPRCWLTEGYLVQELEKWVCQTFEKVFELS